MSATHTVTEAQRLADTVLFPAAVETDAANVLPVGLLDAVASAGLYGLSGPAAAGGIDADFPTACAAIEAIASGCLTTAFVWVQHVGVVRAVAASENESVRERLSGLCSGKERAGLALGGALAGPPQLVARRAGDGWRFDGTSPWVSGWGRIDLLHAAARTDDGRLVWALPDARESETLTVERLRLVALNATATVRATFHGHAVEPARVVSVGPYGEGPAPPEVLRIHAALALGVAARCCRLMPPSPLDEELGALRMRLDTLDQQTIEVERGAAGELALRAAAALCATTGSRSLLAQEHAQRLAREALFTLVYALRPGSREALLARLGGPEGRR